MTFKQDDDITPVIFRMPLKERVRDTVTGKMYWHQDGVIALFPAELGTDDPYTCSSYVHVGQHGSADPHYVINKTRAATPVEYADLKRELESEPYGYRLKVYQKLQRTFLKARQDQARAMRASA